jgi:hypothetical protein
MKKKYQISICEVNNFISTFYDVTKEYIQYEFSQNNDDISKHLSQYFESYKKGEILDGERLSQLFFPTNIKERFNIFISHSGEDKDIVEKFAKTIEGFGKNCFVDWMVWGNIETLQQKVDNTLCRHTTKENGGTTYSYEDRNHTTAHTHAMLSMALLDMIDQCDICILITSENSTLPSENSGDIKTLSPWIYEEVSYMNHLANEKDKVRLFDSRNIKVKISHALDIRDFEVLSSQELAFKLLGITD